MTTITPDHNSGACHEASENRRIILEKLQNLAYQLENCENELKTLQPPFDMSQPPSEGHHGQQDNYHNREPCQQGDQRSQHGDQHGGNKEFTCFTMCSDSAPCNDSPKKGATPSQRGLQDGGGHAYEKRYVRVDPTKSPLSVCPEYSKAPKKPRTPPERLKFDLERTKSRALIGGTLYTGCDCLRRNGLQDQCRRAECRGRPECMTKPEPTCMPSQGPQILPREAVEAKKQLEKPYLKICCQCPADCYEKKQQNFQMEQPPQQQKEQLRLCCYRCPTKDVNTPTHDDQLLKGQFDRRLQCMEVDNMRGPLMNR